MIVSDPSILEALPPESDSQSNNIVVYPIKLLNTVALWEREQLDVWVNLIGQKTGQKVKIPVFIRLIGQKPQATSELGSFLFLIFLFLRLIMLLT